jgi:hypothetical protein
MNLCVRIALIVTLLSSPAVEGAPDVSPSPSPSPNVPDLQQPSLSLSPLVNPEGNYQLPNSPTSGNTGATQNDIAPQAPTVLGQNIVKDVVWENGSVLVRPCDLRFTISEKWAPAPKEVFNFPEDTGFMLGRMGIKDKQGHEIIPTIAMFWQKIDYVEMDAKKGQEVDPLFVYVMSNKPRSKDFHVDRIFCWQDGPLTLRYAAGWQYSAQFNGRPSKAIAVYSINKGKRLGIQILLQVPEDVWPELKNEVESILKSFTVTSTTSFGKREAFLWNSDGVIMLDFRDSPK